MSANAHTPAGAGEAAQSPAEAELLMQHLGDVMDQLVTVIEEETRLVRAGKLREAAEVEATKTELAKLYVLDTLRIKADRQHLGQAAPEASASLRERHDRFRAMLQTNLTVLATAHALSESIMRSVADELARKATPQGYGARGHAAVPSASSHQPLTLSRCF